MDIGISATHRKSSSRTTPTGANACSNVIAWDLGGQEGDGRELTTISMLQEGDAEGHKDQACHNEVGRHTLHAMQGRHQGPRLLQCVCQS